jgi:hypothetical protein
MYLTPQGAWTNKRRQAVALNPDKSHEAATRLQNGEPPQNVFRDCAEQCGECLFMRDLPAAPLNSEGRCSICGKVVRSWGWE